MKSIIPINELQTLATKARSAILTMTTLAASGHPGGSMSSIDLLLALYFKQTSEDRPQTSDKVIVSNGHISPAVYSSLALRGHFDINDTIVQFRLAGSPFEGHIEPDVPGIEWATGNLGQGLSAATGFALESRIKGLNNYIYCLMGDGEQQKGQITEARRFAFKYKLHNLTAIIDYNKLQISGNIDEVMPHNIKANYEADGWKVLQIDGHDYTQIFEALQKAQDIDAPVLILAETVMGKGVSFMEDKEKYHGSPLPESDLFKAYEELGYAFPYNEMKEKRAKIRADKSFTKFDHLNSTKKQYSFTVNKKKLYDKPTDNRSAWGDALTDIALSTVNSQKSDEIAVFDCDLAGSVKTAEFAKTKPDRFFQAGIMEHHTAVCAGALSKTGIQTFFVDFGVFGIDETYNQHRLNDINNANLKVILTHVGLDVGEDGKTHQCIDYIGMVNNMFGYKLIIPADPNQTYKAINYIANQYGNYLVPMGRSKIDIIRKENGDIFYDKDYEFVYGKADIIREGSIGCVMVTGSLLSVAVKAVDALNAQGRSIKLINISSPLAIKPEIIEEAVKTNLIFTIEDHNIHTGLGAIVAQKMIAQQMTCPLVKLGVNRYACSGSAEDVYAMMGLDQQTIMNTISATLEKNISDKE